MTNLLAIMGFVFCAALVYLQMLSKWLKNICSYAVERDKAFRSVGCLLGRVRESSSAARPASETQLKIENKKHEIQIDLRQVVASCKGLSSCLTSVEVKRSELDDIYVLLKRCILQDIICQKLKTIVDNLTNTEVSLLNSTNLLFLKF